jgi:hypothetical protein
LCKLKQLSSADCSNFLESNHLQGDSKSPIRIGLFFEEELVSVMTFSNLRVIMGNKDKDKKSYELVRFSTIDDCRVIGIFGKLVKIFIQEHQPRLLVSYADKRWSLRNDNIYEKTGFSLAKETQPNYWYVKKYTREHRFNFTKQKLVKLGYDPLKTERQTMQELGYDRIWDCGHFRYEMAF